MTQESFDNDPTINIDIKWLHVRYLVCIYFSWIDEFSRSHSIFIRSIAELVLSSKHKCKHSWISKQQQYRRLAHKRHMRTYGSNVTYEVQTIVTSITQTPYIML